MEELNGFSPLHQTLGQRFQKGFSTPCFLLPSLLASPHWVAWTAQLVPASGFFLACSHISKPSYLEIFLRFLNSHVVLEEAFSVLNPQRKLLTCNPHIWCLVFVLFCLSL